MKTSLTYCIKDYLKFNFNFYKNKIYTIIYDDSDIDTPIHIIDENKKVFKFHEMSNFNKNIRNEHFISLQHSRQLKLKKLNEIRI